MDVRFGFLFLFVLGASWACDARQLEAAEVVISDASGNSVRVLVIFVYVLVSFQFFLKILVFFS